MASFRCSALTIAATATHLVAQGPADRLSGRVELLRGEDRRPQAGQWVTLHRVGSDASGPLDSVRTDASGRFTFRYRPFGDSSALYLAATQYGGVAYYAPPTHAGDQAREGLISVFDTTSARTALRITSRHIVVSAPDSGESRVVLEMFILSNSGDRTLVTGEGRRSTFEAPMPPGARTPTIGEGDVAGDAMTFSDGWMRVSTPIAPGTKRVSYSYRVPATAAPLQLGATGTTAFLEILVEDSAAIVTGPGIREVAPTVVAGRAFKRFLGANMESQGIAVMTPGAARGAAIGLVPAVVLATAAGMAATLFFALRRGPAAQ